MIHLLKLIRGHVFGPEADLGRGIALPVAVEDSIILLEQCSDRSMGKRGKDAEFRPQ